MENKIIKMVSKGYTIVVTSWENDGDNFNTKSMVVETLEEATAIYKLMQLCKSKNNGGVFGNSTDLFNKKQLEILGNFFRENPAALKQFFKDNPEIDPNNITNDEYDEYFDEFLKNNLLSSSDFFYCRVMHHCEVTYSPDDIFVQKIF
jgi:hypothetical protein